MDRKISTRALTGPDGDLLQAEFSDLDFDLPVSGGAGRPVIAQRPRHKLRLSIIDRDNLRLFSINASATEPNFDSKRSSMLAAAKRRLQDHLWIEDTDYPLE